MQNKADTEKITQETLSHGKKKKAAIVDMISVKVQKAKSFVFTDYQGLTHHQLEAIKKAMKKLDADYIATKNTLLKRALAALPAEQELASRGSFNGPTATLFIYNEPVEPLKELSKSIKILNRPVIKSGIIDGIVYGASDIERLALIPPLNVLRAQFLGHLQSPIAGMHRALNWNLQKLVLTLNAVKEKKSN